MKGNDSNRRLKACIRDIIVYGISLFHSQKVVGHFLNILYQSDKPISVAVVSYWHQTYIIADLYLIIVYRV